LIDFGEMKAVGSCTFLYKYKQSIIMVGLDIIFDRNWSNIMKDKKIPSNEIEKYSQKHYRKKNVITLIAFSVTATILWFLAFYFFWHFFEVLNPAIRLERFGDFILGVSFILGGLVALMGIVDVGADMISDFQRRKALLNYAKEKKII